MTTETGCRVSVDELKHDRDSDARSRRIEALYVEKLREFRNGVTFGDMSEAISECGHASTLEKLVTAYRRSDYTEIGIMLTAITNTWTAFQASKEVERMIERGEV